MENNSKSVNDLFRDNDLFSDIKFDSVDDNQNQNQHVEENKDINSVEEDKLDETSGFESLPGEDLFKKDDDTKEDDDIISSFLKEHNVNPDGVLIDDERVPFSELPHDQQLDILKSLSVSVSDPSLELDESEIELLNEIRARGLNPSSYLESYGKEYASKYIDSLQNESVTVDDLTDDQLFLVDLQANIPDITEEEALEQLELEKNNEALYTKKMNSLRNEYIEKEKFVQEQRRAEQEKEMEELYKQYEETITQSIYQNKSIDLGNISLDLSNDDMNNIAAFILDKDQHGINPLQRALEDPDTLVKMTWFALNGEEAFSQIDSYYKDEIQKVARYNYEKGLNAAKGGDSKKSTRSYTTKPSSKSNNKQEKRNNGPRSVNDLWSI